MTVTKDDAKLNEYRGNLSTQKAAEGMNAAKNNATRLLVDAKILFSAERYPTAAALATLSIEESGKVSILRYLMQLNDADELKKEWKKYRDHRSKNGAWILPALVADGARKLHQFSETKNRDAEHTKILNQIKQISLYTDCYGKCHWSEPNNVIDESLAKLLIASAEILSGKKDTSVRELDLWMELVSPYRLTDELPYALLRWAQAMFKEGLSETSPEDYAKFVLDDDGSSKWVTKKTEKY